MSGVVSLAIAIYQRVKGINQISTYALLGIGSCFLFYASYQTWADERDLLQQTNREYTNTRKLLSSAERTIREDRSFETPHFSVSVLNTILFKPGWFGKGEVIIFVVEIDNNGAPSIGQMGRFTVTLEDHSILPMILAPLADGTQVYFNNCPTYAFYKSDFLLDKLAKPIARNGQSVGYVPFFVSDSKVISKAKYLEISIKDINGNFYSSGIVHFWDTVPKHGVVHYFQGARINDTHVENSQSTNGTGTNQ